MASTSHSHWRHHHHQQQQEQQQQEQFLLNELNLVVRIVLMLFLAASDPAACVLWDPVRVRQTALCMGFLLPLVIFIADEVAPPTSPREQVCPCLVTSSNTHAHTWFTRTHSHLTLTHTHTFFFPLSFLQFPTRWCVASFFQCRLVFHYLSLKKTPFTAGFFLLGYLSSFFWVFIPVHPSS